MDRETVSISRQITSNPVIPKGQSRPDEYRIEERAPKTENSYRTIRVPAAVLKEVSIRKDLAESNRKKLGSSYLDHGYVSSRENGAPHGTASFNVALSKLCERNAFPM